MRILFPADPMSLRRPDPDYEPEVQAAMRAGAGTSLLHYEALVNDRDADRAVRFVEPGGDVLYRGWMLGVEDYSRLCGALESRGLRPAVGPEAYRAAHWLPEWYSAMEERTPRSVWTAGVPSDLSGLLGPFGDGPVIVKDYVKSRKHEWEEACFVPRASDAGHAERVIRRFLELQGPDLAGGIVVREFVDLESAGRHPRSGMPRAREHRLFLVNGRVLGGFGYWEGADPLPPDLPVGEFEALARRVPNPFLSMDVARTAGGEWIVVEVGDGQVSGLPEGADPNEFYERLVEALG